MKLNIEFFINNFIDAIGAGIYKITVKHHNKEELLYIGESVFVLVRCATHLFKFKKDPNYLGFTHESVQDEDITLKLELIETCSNTEIRKKKEKEYIKKYRPKMQSGVSDRMRPIEEKIEVLTNFLSS